MALPHRSLQLVEALARGLFGILIALALVLGYPALRVRGPYFVILTFGIAELAKFVVVTIESAVGNFGRILIDVPDINVLYELMFGIAVLAFVLVSIVQRSRFGVALRASAKMKQPPRRLVSMFGWPRSARLRCPGSFRAWSVR